MTNPLPEDKEALAQELAQLLQEESLETLVEISRDLVDAKPEELFGNMEFKVRDRLLALGAAIYQKLLDQKKTATRDVPSIAKDAEATPPSTDTETENP